VDDSIDFILTNFSEMNKLWMRYQGRNFQQKVCCIEEQKRLRMLVGPNLERLSKLEGVNVDKYKSVSVGEFQDKLVNVCCS